MEGSFLAPSHPKDLSPFLVCISLSCFFLHFPQILLFPKYPFCHLLSLAISPYQIKILHPTPKQFSPPWSPKSSVSPLKSPTTAPHFSWFHNCPSVQHFSSVLQQYTFSTLFFVGCPQITEEQHLLCVAGAERRWPDLSVTQHQWLDMGLLTLLAHSSLSWSLTSAEQGICREKGWKHSLPASPLLQRKLTLDLGLMRLTSTALLISLGTVGTDPWTDLGPEQITEPLPLS